MPGLATPAADRALDAGAHRRVRWAMYIAFAVLAAVALFEASFARRTETIRMVAADLVSLAAEQRLLVVEIASMAVTVSYEGGVKPSDIDRLRRMLDATRSDALLADAMIEEQRQAFGGAMGGVVQAQALWLGSRDKLWLGCEAMLRSLAERDMVAAPAAASAVQIDAQPALAALSRLAEQLQAVEHSVSREQVRLLYFGVALALVVLALLSLFVVEPTARAVRRQVRRLADQAAELARMALVAERTDNHVVITDAERRVEWVNEAFTRETGYRLDEARGRNPAQLLHSDANDPVAVAHLQAALAAGEGLRAELLCRAKDGREFWLEADFQPLRDADGLLRGYVTVGHDATERRRLQEQLRHAARTDTLTGLPNRSVVLDRVQRAIQHAAQHAGYGYAVLFMDFDRFKQVNDTLGHAAGDQMLRQIAVRIEETLRPGDAVARVPSHLRTAARIGGDEFVVVLEGMRGVDDAVTVAERLLAVLSEPYRLGAHTVQSSASIGIVTADHAAASADEVLRDADTAMYEAKRAGRGRCVVFDSSMHERVVKALAFETELRRAVREGELFVVYQPVVDLNSGALVGAEALVRWRHPTQGVVTPAHFIGLAEETGLIDAIGGHVLESACAQFVRWRAELGARAPIELAVNLSRAQLERPELAAEVSAVLERCGMRAAELQFEITESLAAQSERVQAALRELKSLGVRLALDDFGTGYSSLACLHQLPVDTVKIDRSFVRHAETVEYHRVLIEATIRVARALRMTTVAEGIETTGEATLMEQLHCNRGQGYLFGKPMAADEFARWVLATADA